MNNNSVVCSTLALSMNCKVVFEYLTNSAVLYITVHFSPDDWMIHIHETIL